jgi:hypothetical protein
MKTWTCRRFDGHWPVGTALVVTAENIDVAIDLVEKELAARDLPQKIEQDQLVLLPTHCRHVRILCDGDY